MTQSTRAGEGGTQEKFQAHELEDLENNFFHARSFLKNEDG